MVSCNAQHNIAGVCLHLKEWLEEFDVAWAASALRQVKQASWAALGTQVAKGYRRPIPEHWPRELETLVTVSVSSLTKATEHCC